MIRVNNPYPLTKQDASGRLHADIPLSIHKKLLDIFPGHGNIQAVVNTLISQLINDYAKRNISCYDFLNEGEILELLYRRGPLASPAHRASARKVKRGTPGDDLIAPLSDDQQPCDLQAGGEGALRVEGKKGKSSRKKPGHQ